MMVQIFLAALLAGTAPVQHLSHPVMQSGSDARTSPRNTLLQPDTVSILAVRAQFQPDTDTRSTGNGRFDLSSGSAQIIEAPPRDAGYFAQHLLFLENYYRRSSKGKAIIRWVLLDSVITLPSVMQTYSPQRGETNIRAANLARDVWRAVDSAGMVADFSPYNCFVVFHAGVGRDVDLTSALGYDPTPFDIPSLFFGLSGFRQVYGEAFQGIPVTGGMITNSIILPETDNRVIPSAAGDVLLSLSINGLLCSSVGNFLGLPDLFNTTTGRSAIGRFGLMDGQAIFSFSGLFPPEPSAWEKYWLGWIDPVVVGTGTLTTSLPAVGISDSVLLVPISTREYYLVENRNRDPLRNGQHITSVFNGVQRQQVFLRDTVGFNAFDLRSIAGSVTDVEDLDWSLPGGVSSSGEFFDGGILIWHIDENRIAAGLPANAVNPSRDHRGVDLEEADGSQDIGEEYDFLSPGSGSEEGTALDFWYTGNSSPVYRNRFSASSYPNTSSNAGAVTHIAITDFGARGPRMSLTVSTSDGAIAPLAQFPRRTGETVPAFTGITVGAGSGTTDVAIAVTTSGEEVAPFVRMPGPAGTTPSKVFAWSSSGGAAYSGLFRNGLAAAAQISPPLPLLSRFTAGVSLADLNADGIPDLVTGQSDVSIPGGGPPPVWRLRAFTARDAGTDSLADELFATALARAPSTPPVVGDSLIALGVSHGGWVMFFSRDGRLIDSVQVSAVVDATITGVCRGREGNTFIATASDGSLIETFRLPGGGTISPDVRRTLPGAIVAPPVTGTFGAGNTQTRIICQTATGWLYALDEGFRDVPGFPVRAGDSLHLPAALADVNGDGLRDIVVVTGQSIHAYNHAGASVDYFPVRVPTDTVLTAGPIVADVDGDGRAEVLAASGDGLVFAYDRRGKPGAGFPLQAAAGVTALAAFVSQFSGQAGIGLVASSGGDGSVSAWRTGTPASVSNLMPWPQYQKDGLRSGAAFETLSGAPSSTEFFPGQRAYNWPNPVYDGTTYIRYFVRDDARVSISVFDMAGDLVQEFSGPGIGGVDNEVAWDVSGIQSGIYMARIEAQGGGASGVAIIKVAIVR